MGTTVRREPVVSKIPKAQEYKYLNITDFRGISKSSNPFTQPYNTASDALNVYVDETNALTTRPRLEKFADITQLDEIVAAFNITDGFLIQGKKNNAWKLYIKTATNIPEVTVPTGVTLNAKIIAVFEQDDKIYFINGSNYYVITVNNGTYTVDYVEGYVPTTIVGSTLTTKGKEFESLNLLTDKYKETYFWDGSWNFERVLKDSDVVENGYVTTTFPQRQITINKIFRYLENNPTVALCSRSSNIDILYFRGILDNSNDDNTYTLSSYTVPSHDELYGDCSSDGKSYAYYYKANGSSSDTIDGGVYVYNNSKWYQLINDTSKNCTVTQYSDDEEYVIRANNDCTIVACVYENYNNTGYYVDVFRYNASTDSYEAVIHQQFIDNTAVYINMSRNGNTVIVKSVGTNKVYYVSGLKTAATGITITSILTEEQCKVVISPNGKMLYTYASGQSSSSLYDISEGFNKTAIYKGFVKNACFSEENDRLLISSGDHPADNDGWLDIQSMEFIPTGIINTSVNKSPKLYFSHNEIIVKAPTTSSFDHTYKTYDFNSTEPLLTIIRTVEFGDSDYDEWYNNKPRKSKLVTRFNNEHWFASGNKTFYTQYNDPTYIPMKSYNINGDQDDITAMNVLSDSILGLYKKDDLWLVQQTYDSNGDVVYYYNENNNVVGNDAYNAAITTIHSNLPIQITYDGIYTIQQQENVSAPDRLAKSISDAIAELWQSETDSVVANAITLNRLYWTYILLPYADFTKVYLLDNRTLSWYYWELPIMLASAFVKDNKVYFATKDSMLVTLETSDVTKILSQNASISEYYDLDRQIINWYWQSQILPLGTINYTKKLINTTFIVTDTDENDGYSLQYQFNVFRRKMGVTNVKNITNKLNYVQSVTKKTFISRFNFIQLKLSNMYEDLDNNKLRLVGLGLKYELLEGML